MNTYFTSIFKTKVSYISQSDNTIDSGSHVRCPNWMYDQMRILYWGTSIQSKKIIIQYAFQNHIFLCNTKQMLNFLLSFWIFKSAKECKEPWIMDLGGKWWGCMGYTNISWYIHLFFLFVLCKYCSLSSCLTLYYCILNCLHLEIYTIVYNV